MSLTEFVIFSLAVFRIVYLIQRDYCPFGVCEKLRQRVLMKVARYNELSQPVYEPRQNELSTLLMCPVCLSIWVAIFFAYHDNLFRWLAQILALSGAAMLIWKFYVK